MATSLRSPISIVLLCFYIGLNKKFSNEVIEYSSNTMAFLEKYRQFLKVSQLTKEIVQ
jgi:hypothetical protein